MTTLTEFVPPPNECVLPEPRIAVLWPTGYQDRKTFMALLKRLRDRFDTLEVCYIVASLDHHDNPLREYVLALQLFNCPFIQAADPTETWDAVLAYATHAVIIDPADDDMAWFKTQWEKTQRPLRVIAGR